MSGLSIFLGQLLWIEDQFHGGIIMASMAYSMSVLKMRCIVKKNARTNLSYGKEKRMIVYFSLDFKIMGILTD